MNVKEIMKKDVITVTRSTSLRALLKLFDSFHRLPLIPVVNDENVIIGVVYIANLLDILRPKAPKLLKNIPFVELDEEAFDLEVAPLMGDLLLVDDIMEEHFISLDEEMPLEKAYGVMRLHGRDQLPVMGKDNKLLGIVGIFDIIRRMFKEKGIL